ncbi:MAG TPA: hypothetical protein ENF26_06990 [Methanomicrobia archaeon]|nr:hypothetical protein [Methanomicrobia archaeon]HEX59873.1 hypothetical protein [Methanomicrobia archaeon]
MRTLRKGCMLVMLIAVLLTPIAAAYEASLAKYPDKVVEAKFVEVDVENSEISYSEIMGMIREGGSVRISLILKNFSPDVKGRRSVLNFTTELEDAVWGLSEETGVSVLSKTEKSMRLRVDHGLVSSLIITLDGKAPEVSKRENVTLLNVDQEIERTYPVMEIWGKVTSELIETAILKLNEALDSIEAANATLYNATQQGADVSDAKADLDHARLYYDDALSHYNAGRINESIMAAENATYYANLAKSEAESSLKAISTRNYVVVGTIVAVVAVTAAILLARRRRPPLG